MKTGKAVGILLTTLSFVVMSLGSPVTARPGDTITIFNKSNIFNIADALIECKRPGLGPDVIVLFFRENRTYPDNTDSSYQYRVGLSCCQDSVFTVELIDLTRNDSGLYKCTLMSPVSGDFTQYSRVQVSDPEEVAHSRGRMVTVMAWVM